MSDDAGFNALLGRTVGFCGVDGSSFCLSVGGRRLAFEALEDEVDGYRSMMADVAAVPVAGRTFFRRPIAHVTIERVGRDGDEFEGYRVVDGSGHVWLRFGTDHTVDYYPMFTFEYTPPR